MAVVIVNLCILGILVLLGQLVLCALSQLLFTQEKIAYVFNNTDIDIACLFWWIGRRYIGFEWVAESFNITALGLDGDLLAGTLSFERGRHGIRLAIGRRQGRWGGSLGSRVMAITG